MSGNSLPRKLQLLGRRVSIGRSARRLMPANYSNCALSFKTRNLIHHQPQRHVYFSSVSWLYDSVLVHTALCNCQFSVHDKKMYATAVIWLANLHSTSRNVSALLSSTVQSCSQWETLLRWLFMDSCRHLTGEVLHIRYLLLEI